MNMIENVAQPLTKCPACAGRGMVYYTVTVGDETTQSDPVECGLCETLGECTLAAADNYLEWNN